MENPAENPKDQIADRLKQATNVLVTVSSSPSVDQLAGAIGLTLLLNKLGKHATAVFSGQIPSTLEFLQPEKTLESNTDSLRDFIIALDKSKADKLRYKVEDQMVKIFITPYRTAISDKDLEFSQGDFNVEVVLALGIKQQQDLDQAITSHGRILHDATVVSIGTSDGSSLGSINWVDPQASSLSEMLLDVGLALKADVLDGQMATAFLTGIVAETNRFSNEKTSAETMQLSAKLMAAGANQQLIASQLQSPPVESVNDEADAELPEVAEAAPNTPPAEPLTETPAKSQETKQADGSLEIDHGDKKQQPDAEDAESEDEEPDEERLEQIHIDNEGVLKPAEEVDAKAAQQLGADSNSPHLILQPPTLGGTLTASSSGESFDPSLDPLAPNTAAAGSLLSHEPDSSVKPFGTPPAADPSTGYMSAGMSNPATELPAIPSPTFSPVAPATPTVLDAAPPTSASEPASQQSPDTLAELEKVVDSPHIDQLSTPPASNQPADDVNAARDAVSQAVSGTAPQVLEPVQSLNAQPMDLNLGDIPAVNTSPAASFASNPMINPSMPAAASTGPAIMPETPLPPGLVPSDPGLPTDTTDTVVVNPTAPPPVPPPMIPPSMQPGSNEPGAASF